MNQAPQELEEIAVPAAQLPRSILSILVMLFVALLVTLAMRQFFRMVRRPPDVDTEAISPLEGLVLPDRLGWGRRLMNRLSALRRWRAAASIRYIYRQMSAEASDRGYPRVASETPYEYLATLAQAWPDHHADTLLITEAYNRVRYGEIPETRDELNLILDAWKRLEGTSPAESQADQSEVEILRRH